MDITAISAADNSAAADALPFSGMFSVPGMPSAPPLFSASLFIKPVSAAGAFCVCPCVFCVCVFCSVLTDSCHVIKIHRIIDANPTLLHVRLYR